MGCGLQNADAKLWTSGRSASAAPPISVKSTVEHIQECDMEGMATEAALLQAAT